MATKISCKLRCQNGGYCNYVSSDESTLLQIFASGGLLEKCICPPGYTGLTCETVVEECLLPKLQCHNGVPCMLQTGAETEAHYVCDCSVADALSVFAGNMCRNPATTYCGEGEIVNRSFCTNGGLCLENLKSSTVNEYVTHKGCKCPPEFEGEHCEYVRGMAPKVVKEEHSERTVANKTASEYSPALIAEHTKTSEELAAPSDTGSFPVQNAASDGFETSKNVVPELIVTPSESLAAKPLLQSNTFTTTPKPPSKRVAPPVVQIENTTTVSNHAYAGSIAGLTISLMGITVFAGAILVRNRRQRKLRKSRNASNVHTGQHLASLDRDNYHDETPIRVRVLAEDENNELQLDEVLGEDDDVMSIGECSLEEIELEGDGCSSNYAEYLRGISDDFVGYSDSEIQKKEDQAGFFPNFL
ncbi:hypothetical protein HJC23_013507 [Cyclotella cryptica]|uniref:EGF-like domain-containing protein n=1 Tax=Cyclotella cryptica TaxID=29204 RepID=A0ABD3QBB4_9STRA|eukprot:CCRYP_006954-RA/>CCRYP_006954-RA protein AED:0.02 eAED:0.02 QI:1244/1/1/1/1/1/2/64/415